MITKKELTQMILKGEDISDIDYSHITDMSYMFEETNITFELLKKAKLNTSNVTDMQWMFCCSELESIPLLDTSKVINMEGMFKGCTKLESIPLLDTSNVADMSWMFNGCSNLKTIPILDTSNVTDMRLMFRGCSNLKHFEDPTVFHLYDFSEEFLWLKKDYPDLFV